MVLIIFLSGLMWTWAVITDIASALPSPQRGTHKVRIILSFINVEPSETRGTPIDLYI